MTERKRISMWSGPRNISTTMMYSFAQRADTEVVDEPLYAHYITKVPGLDHPGTDEVLASQTSDLSSVIQELGRPGHRPVRFYKNMGHHLFGVDDWSFLSGFENFLLTRHPADVIRSITKNMERPQLRDLGYSFLVDIVGFLEGQDIEPIVVVSSDILADPENVLAILCARLGLAWDPGMLSWPAGPRPEDGVWAKYWYRSVHESTGFRPYAPNDQPLPVKYQPLLEEAMPYYERLSEYAINRG